MKWNHRFLNDIETHGKKVNDSLIDEETAWLKYVDELDETKSPWLINSGTADALVARDRALLDTSINENKNIVMWCDDY